MTRLFTDIRISIINTNTPHLHVDYVPYVAESSRGLATRVSLKGALAKQGFVGSSRQDTEWHRWVEAEKRELAAVMERYGVKWKQLGTHNQHISVYDYKKQERIKEVEALEKQVDSTEEEFLKTKKMLGIARMNWRIWKLSRRLPNWRMKRWWTRTIS